MRLRFLLFLLCNYAAVATAQFTWDNGSWEQVITKAEQEDKLIFLDVYTIWCGPCLKMDKDVWVDSSVQEVYNDTYISVKVNAEDPARGLGIAKRFNTTAYPTLLYLDPAGNVISKYVGGKNKYEMLDLSAKVQDLYHHKGFIDRVKSEIDAHYSHDELSKILDITLDHDFTGKEKIAMRYLDNIETIGEDDIRRVMPEVGNMEIGYLSRLAPLTGTVSYSDMYVRRNSKEWVSWRTDTERAIYKFLKTYQESGNLKGYEQTIEVLKGIEGVKPRKIDNLYLGFYKRNNLDQYRDFAIYLIDEYIIPTHPDDVKDADERKYKMLHEETTRDMTATGSEIYSDGDITISKSPTIDSLSEIYTISMSIADQLYDISSDFFAFYEDESSKRKASFWAMLATKYYPYDWKYYDNLIYMLEANGEMQKASEVREEAKALPWYNEMKNKISGP